jgi:hypothetical protein
MLESGLTLLADRIPWVPRSSQFPALVAPCLALSGHWTVPTALSHPLIPIDPSPSSTPELSRVGWKRDGIDWAKDD